MNQKTDTKSTQQPTADLLASTADPLAAVAAAAAAAASNKPLLSAAAGVAPNLPLLSPLLYQSPIWQAAAMRQQQLQLLSQIASLTPFLNTTTSSLPVTTSTTTSSAFKDYLTKLDQEKKVEPVSATADKSSYRLPDQTEASSTTADSVRRNNNSKKLTTSLAKRPQGGNRVFTCQTCNRSFGYKHVLQNHERTHTGEKPFECKVCHKRFTRDHHLKTHMRLHTGEKPYSCTQCDRQFVQVANLRRHLRVHTGEKPYLCEICNNRFSDSNQLKNHMMTHEKNAFKCDKCHVNFPMRYQLLEHNCPVLALETDSGSNSPHQTDVVKRPRQRKMMNPAKLSVQTEPEDLSSKSQNMPE